MDDESGESMEPMEEVPLIQLGEAELESHVTCRLTAKNRDQLWNPTLGNRVWATFTLLFAAPLCTYTVTAYCCGNKLLQQHC